MCEDLKPCVISHLFPYAFVILSYWRFLCEMYFNLGEIEHSVHLSSSLLQQPLFFSLFMFLTFIINICSSSIFGLLQEESWYVASPKFTRVTWHPFILKPYIRSFNTLYIHILLQGTDSNVKTLSCNFLLNGWLSPYNQQLMIGICRMDLNHRCCDDIGEQIFHLGSSPKSQGQHLNLSVGPLAPYLKRILCDMCVGALL